MAATAIQTQILPKLPIEQTIEVKKREISWETFQKRYLQREDGFKYEWVGGLVVKTERSMDKTQLYIQRNLQAFFRNLLFENKVSGEIIAEPDLFFLKNHRRPDMAWLTDEQIDKLADSSEVEIPAFVIEVISNNDQTNKVKDKMINYRDAGVQVVWQIFPNQQQVDVYTGTFLEKMTVCFGEKLCSAAPVLLDFVMPANAIFYKKTTKK
jgi:Uma2 family endonuclease